MTDRSGEEEGDGRAGAEGLSLLLFSHTGSERPCSLG